MRVGNAAHAQVAGGAKECELLNKEGGVRIINAHEQVPWM